MHKLFLLLSQNSQDQTRIRWCLSLRFLLIDKKLFTGKQLGVKISSEPMNTLQVHRVFVRFGVVSMNGNLCENDRVIYIVVQIACPGDTVHISHTDFKVYYAICTSDILSHLGFFFSTHPFNKLYKPFHRRLKNKTRALFANVLVLYISF